MAHLSDFLSDHDAPTFGGLLEELRTLIAQINEAIDQAYADQGPKKKLNATGGTYTYDIRPEHLKRCVQLYAELEEYIMSHPHILRSAECDIKDGLRAIEYRMGDHLMGLRYVANFPTKEERQRYQSDCESAYKMMFG